MKKISALIAALMGLALIVGCSNDSDGGSSYFGPALPASQGDFTPAGKTFKFEYGDSKSTIQFGLGVLTMTDEEKQEAQEGFCSAYTQKKVANYRYSWNQETKSVYLAQISDADYIVRDNIETLLPSYPVLVSDDQFVAYITDYLKLVGDKLNDQNREVMIKQMRYRGFEKYGYTDDTGATAVDARVIARYNEGLAAKKNLISSRRYECDGATLKVVSDRTVPQGLKFSQICNAYSINETSNGVKLFVSGQDPYGSPNLVDGTTGYLISSVDADYIYTSKKGAATVGSRSLVWSYTSSDKKFKYNDTANTASSDILDVQIVDFGTFEIKYATSSNADFTHATTYTVQLQ